MTCHAACFKLRGSVVRGRCCAKRNLVTTVTVLRCVLEDTTHMTRGTWSRDMHAGQRKCRCVVIKTRSPAVGIDLMAFLAIRSKAGEGVTRVLGILIIRAVTSVASDRSPCIFVV
jgi:hypothetical protein